MSSSENTNNFKIELHPEDYNQYDMSFKMIIVGDAGVGKSCLTAKASKGKFEESYTATVGFEFMLFNLKINDKVIKLQIWDTCGQEIYRSLISSFYRNASLAMMVYAIDDIQSYKHIETWLKEVKLQSNPDIKVFLIGNKADLDKNRVVKTETAKAFKEENKLNYFSETSAKSGFNAKEVFIEAAKLLYSDSLKYKEGNYKDINDNDYVPNPVRVTKSKKNIRKKGGCC